MTINERVKIIRKAKSLTMEEFGGKIGIGRSSVSLLESGRNNPSDQTIRSIVREFHVNEAWLRTGEGEMFAQLEPDDELATAVERLMSGETADFKRRLIAVLSRLDENQWQFLQDRLTEIVGERPESEP